MTSYLPFSTSSTSQSPATSTLVSDDPHLEISVTPSSSAFYAGESFSVTISFRNTRRASTVPAAPASSATTDVPSAARTLPSFDQRGVPLFLPQRRGRVGKQKSEDTQSEDTYLSNAEAGPSKAPAPLILATTPDLPAAAGYPYSPGANPAYRAHGWPTRDDGAETTIRSPEAWRKQEYGVLGKEFGHGRRAKSLALGKGAVSPQEMVWALSGHTGEY